MQSEKSGILSRVGLRIGLAVGLMLVILVMFGRTTVGTESAEIERKALLLSAEQDQIFEFNKTCLDGNGAHVGHTHTHGAIGHISPLDRFSACTWPPQMKNISNVVWNETASNTRSPEADQARIARGIAEENTEVQKQLGERFSYIISSPIRPEKWSDEVAAHLVTFFSYTNNKTIEVIIKDNVVSQFEAFEASEKQPPLQESEVDDAVLLARKYWLEEEVGRVNQLKGFALQTFQTEGDGGFYDTRMAYVTFHADATAAPELLTWVDLTNEVVVHGAFEQGFDRSPISEGGDSSLWMPIVRSSIFKTGEPIDPFDTREVRGEIDWEGWQFDYELGFETDGLAISNVTFQGTKIMGRGGFPAMPVYYEDNQCGPFLDVIFNYVDVRWAPNTEGIVTREFMVDGERWYELGARTFIGNYDIYQVWYFSPDGVIDAHLFSRGLECVYFHEHYPHWRFDFDIGGPESDQILRQTPAGLEAHTTEFNVTADTAEAHGWIVQDSQTDYRINLDFDSGAWTVPGTVIPETQYNNNRVAGRLNRPNELGWLTDLPVNWGDGAGIMPHGNGEAINETDLVVWYSGYLPHESTDGPSLWHSTGVRLTLEPN